MKYFNTDVLVNFHWVQDQNKHEQANKLYREASSRSEFFLSLLCLQETSFVLHKLGEKHSDIETLLATLLL